MTPKPWKYTCRVCSYCKHTRTHEQAMTAMEEHRFDCPDGLITYNGQRLTAALIRELATGEKK